MSNVTNMVRDNITAIFDLTTTDAHLNVTDSSTELNGSSGIPLLDVRSAGPAYWAANVIVSVIGLMGNTMVIVLLTDVKFSSLSYPVYLRFLAVSDSAVLVMFCIQESFRFFKSFQFIGSGMASCTAWKFTKYTVTLLSPWLMVGLTLDRFYSVVFPLRRGRFCTWRKSTIVCVSTTALSGILMLPLFGSVKTVDTSDICLIEDDFVIYFAFVRLLFSSTLPCLLILCLNIVIGISIRRSVTFRKRFSTTATRSSDPPHDKATRPLMLISMLAFVTLVPSAITASVLGILLLTRSDFNTMTLFTKLWPLSNILYLVNFGQNFYILMASSANYRTIIMTKTRCTTVCKKSENATLGTGPLEGSDSVDGKTNITELNSIASLHSCRSTSLTSPTTLSHAVSKRYEHN